MNGTEAMDHVRDEMAKAEARMEERLEQHGQA